MHIHPQLVMRCQEAFLGNIPWSKSLLFEISIVRLFVAFTAAHLPFIVDENYEKQLRSLAVISPPFSLLSSILTH